MTQYITHDQEGNPVRHKVLGQYLDVENDRPKVATATFDPQHREPSRWDRIVDLVRQEAHALALFEDYDEDDNLDLVPYLATVAELKAEEGMTLEEWGALAHLALLAEIEADRHTAGDLARALGRSPQAVADLLLTLERKRYIEVIVSAQSAARQGLSIVVGFFG